MRNISTVWSALTKERMDVRCYGYRVLFRDVVRSSMFQKVASGHTTALILVIPVSPIIITQPQCQWIVPTSLPS